MGAWSRRDAKEQRGHVQEQYSPSAAMRKYSDMQIPRKKMPAFCPSHAGVAAGAQQAVGALAVGGPFMGLKMS
jgi:hypothetical protein